MKFLSVIALALLGSCASFDQSKFRASYVNLSPSTELAEDDADEFSGSSGEIGLMYGEGSANRGRGLVSDFALSGLSTDGDVTTDIIPGVTAETDHVSIDLVGVRTGVRLYLDGIPSKFFQPYIGAGLLAQVGRFDAGGDDKDTTTAVGFSGMVGVDTILGDHVRLGVGYQLTSGMDFETDGVEVDMDSRGLFFSLGVGF